MVETWTPYAQAIFEIKVNNLSQKNFFAIITIKKVEIQTKTTSVKEIRR